jgi:multidrug resistance efflux pump
LGEHSHSTVEARYAAALAEREAECAEHKETVGILELKVAKLEQLVRLKDAKIQKLQAAVAQSRAPAPSNFSDISSAN